MTEYTNQRGSASNTPQRIVILEDDEAVATLQQSRLSALGFQVEIAANSTEAFALLQKGRPALLIVDYRLNEENNGLDFYRHLVERGNPVPAILVTGLGQDQMLAEAMRLGVRGFVLKTLNYWRDLEGTVMRVTRQVALERQALESEAVRESEARLQAAFAAAGVGHWRWNTRDGSVSFSETLCEVLGCAPATLEEFLACAHPDDRLQVSELFAELKSAPAPLQLEFRIVGSDGRVRWIGVRGSPVIGTPERIVHVTGVASDISARKTAELKLVESYTEIQMLNERLRASLVETHHRVKNSLQTVSSLLNMEVRRRPSLSSEDVHRLVSHIQSFAALHEILAEHSKTGDGDAIKLVAAEELFNRLLEILQPLAGGRLIIDRLDSFMVTARQSSALGILCNELVSNALKHGCGTIILRVLASGGQCVLELENEGSEFPRNFQPEKTGRSGLCLMKAIVRAELGSDLVFQNKPGKWAHVSVAFPLPAASQRVTDASASANELVL